MTTLRGADGQVYALTQGELVVGGLGAEGNDGSSITVNVPSVGRIPNGASVERTVPSPFSAGGALVFVTTLKELPVTLLLAPTGFTTLAVRIWAAADELLYARAASSALILIAVSVVPIYYLSIKPKDILDR